uniref:Uncharacterized protein n=1 Tax=uncultured marine virus TaxID=186617 RepID=A0A0F7L453_9VIRU|nr:hypothetical protein [uncultured marine virus]
MRLRRRLRSFRRRSCIERSASRRAAGCRAPTVRRKETGWPTERAPYPKPWPHLSRRSGHGS